MPVVTDGCAVCSRSTLPACSMAPTLKLERMIRLLNTGISCRHQLHVVVAAAFRLDDLRNEYLVENPKKQKLRRVAASITGVTAFLHYLRISRWLAGRSQISPFLSLKPSQDSISKNPHLLPMMHVRKTKCFPPGFKRTNLLFCLSSGRSRSWPEANPSQWDHHTLDYAKTDGFPGFQRNRS